MVTVRCFPFLAMVATIARGSAECVIRTGYHIEGCDGVPGEVARGQEQASWCCGQCEQKPECEFFVYDEKEKICYFKTGGCGFQQRDGGWQVGSPTGSTALAKLPDRGGDSGDGGGGSGFNPGGGGSGGGGSGFNPGTPAATCESMDIQSQKGGSIVTVSNPPPEAASIFFQYTKPGEKFPKTGSIDVTDGGGTITFMMDELEPGQTAKVDVRPNCGADSARCPNDCSVSVTKGGGGGGGSGGGDGFNPGQKITCDDLDIKTNQVPIITLYEVPGFVRSVRFQFYTPDQPKFPKTHEENMDDDWSGGKVSWSGLSSILRKGESADVKMFFRCQQESIDACPDDCSVSVTHV